MASIRSRGENGCLFFDFRYLGFRCREQTLLPDTAANRKKLQVVLNKIEKATLYLHSLNLDSVNIYHQKMLQSIILRDKSENVGIDNYISQSLLIKLGYDDIDYLILLLTH